MFEHDEDGNLIEVPNGDAAIAPGDQVTYVWDAENRLIRVAPASSPVNGDKKVEYTYDYMNRRVERKVYAYSSGWGSPTEHTRYIYHGWNAILELDALDSNAITKKYTWGLDLAGQNGQVNSLDQAGGIGGLLACLDTAGTPSTADDRTFVYSYDANGNVTQLVETTSGGDLGTLAAAYEYDAYGNTIVASGGYADDNVIRFSTRPVDPLTLLGHWTMRVNDFVRGRWGTRDPIAELGFRVGVIERRAMSALSETYPFVWNHPTNVVDAVGLEECDRCGVEVGPQVDRLLNNLAIRMNALNYTDMVLLCEWKSRDPQRGWDIADFHDLGRCDQTALGRFSSGACGAGACRGTVSYHGRCFRAAELNYLLWGRLNRVCAAYLNVTYERNRILGGDGLDFTLNKALWDVWIFRLKNRVMPCSPCGSTDHGTNQREAATRAGWHYYDSYLDGIQVHECKSCGTRMSGNLFGHVGQTVFDY